MASSSLSPQQNAFSGIEPANKRRKVEESSRLFDVFINHRGPDVKQTLATQLYNSLKERGIRAFLDSEEKELGGSFTSTIETAIRSASVHIAIFSKKYAESAWCLAELVLMLQSKAKIIPLFYEVEPWCLRYIEKGVYAGAFLEYEKKGRYLDKIKEWKEALQQVSYTAGYEFKNSDSSDCKDIVSMVSAVEKEVERTKCLHVAKYPVGLNKLVKDFERRCLNELVQDFESQCDTKKAAKEKANFVGIFGMGGVGKTTLSIELFNQKKSEYTRASFLYDVRENHGSGKLQSRLLKDLFSTENNSFLSSRDGTSCLRDCLERKRSSSCSFLIVLDDIDNVEQLDALLVKDTLNKFPNSLVIITTRDVGVLVSAGIDIGYRLKGLDRDDGRELFCWHAFNQPLPLSGYEDLVQAFLNMCGGLPLSLIVLGRHVFGRDRWYWHDELGKVEETLPGDIKRRLKISIDTLDNVEKQIFMDIACFCIEETITKAMAMAIWKGSGWRARHALETLKEKCLVEEVEKWYPNEWESWGSTLRMHDHLRDLGREMANELSHPRRVWHPQHLKYLELKGFQNILAQTKGRCFHSILDKSMDCEITYFLGEPEDGSDTSLLWLQLDYQRPRPLDLNSYINSSIPSWIPLEYLHCLRIRDACFQELWQSNVQAPSHLKELYINKCPALEELPNLSRLRCLEEIKIESCEKLQNLTLPTTLIRLSVERCRDLQRVAGTGDLTKLTQLYIAECPALEELPNLSTLSCSEEIEIDSCEKLQNLTLPTTLIRLSVFRCRDLQRVAGTGDLTKLTKLNIKKCPALEELPNLSTLSCSEEIEIDSCEKLQNLTLPTTLIRLSVQSCRDLQRVNGDHTKLTKLYIKECPALEELPNLSTLSCSEEIEIDSCENLQNISGIEELQASESMRLHYCSNAAIRKCIHKLKSVPKPACVIGKAVDGAESSLNEDLFCEAGICAGALTPLSCEDFQRSVDDRLQKSKVSSVAILCCVVVVDSSTSVEDINQRLYPDFEVRQGEWIITVVDSYDWHCLWFHSLNVYILRRYGILKKGFLVEVKKGEEWKSVGVLSSIVDRLHHL